MYKIGNYRNSIFLVEFTGNFSIVPELSYNYSNIKTHNSKYAALLQRPFLLAGELSSSAARSLVLLLRLL